MQCPACQRELPEDARFCLGCGARLAESRARAPRARAPRARAPRAYTPNHLAERILRSAASLEGERKQVTVLFADVKGSMELSEQLGPEDWHHILDRFFRILTDGVHRFEGTVNQYTGDGIMALFGAPLAHEDHGQRACYAALGLRESLRAYADELRLERGLDFSVRMGLNSGDVVVGKIGDDLRMDYTAQGQTVGLAQRIEQLAAADSAYLSDATAHLVEGFFELRPLGRANLRGVSEPVDVHELVGPGRLRTRLEASRARGFSRFVGRAAELETLNAALDRAAAGQGGIVNLVAEAGVGKSRLCLVFAEACRARGLEPVEAHCLSHAQVIPWLPILELLRGIFGFVEGDTPEATRRKVAGNLVLLDPDFSKDLPLLFDFLGVPDAARPPSPTEGDSLLRQLTDCLGRLLERRSEREPTVLQVDDAHWIDPASDAFLARLIPVVSRTRTLLVVNFRPEYRAKWLELPDVHTLTLRPLGKEETTELLGELLGEHASTRELAARIAEQTRGNPFFVEEVVYSLADSGALEGERGDYRLAQPSRALRVPASVQGVLAARIDRRPESEKRVLQTAAVIGRSFERSLLASVTELADAELDAELDALVRAELLAEEAIYPERVYAFRHPLTHQVALESQLAERRRDIHRAIARTLRAAEPSGRSQFALLAHHWEGAGESLEAARCHQAASSRMDLSSGRHAERVRELLADEAETDEVRKLLLWALAESAMWSLFTGEGKGLDQAVERARGMLRDREDGHLFGRLLLGMAGSLTAFNPPRARAFSAEAVELLEDSDDLMSQSMARIRVAESMRADRPLAEELAALDDGIAWMRPRLPRQPQPAHVVGSVFRLWRGRCLMLMGDFAGAEHALDDAEALVRGLDLGGVLGSIHAEKRSFLAVLCGDASAARRHALRAIEEGRRVESPWHEAEGYYVLFEAQLFAGEPAAALEALERASTIAVGPFAQSYLVLLPMGTALAKLALGDHTGAVEDARLAAERAEQMNLHYTSLRSQLTLATVLRAAVGRSAEPEIARALARVEQTIDFAGLGHATPYVLLERGQLARLAGDEGTAARLLREAEQVFRAQGAPLRAAGVARLL